ncbi:MAG: hypothetical protein KAU60_09515, partial [Desulfobacterales bacterium]|nr:hypothetical protein [Desulfobacterales bacterium]
TLGNLETGSMAALPIWIEFMIQALADSPFQYFDIPDDVIKVRIDPITGLRASDNSTRTAVALFKKGTEPMPHAKTQRR